MASDEVEVTSEFAAPRWPAALRQMSSDYAEATHLRAAVQILPFVGGALDAMLSGLGTRWQAERLQDFLTDLNARLARLEGVAATAPPVDPSEPLFDFVRQVFQQAVATRSRDRRQRLAQILVHQVEHQGPWEEAETATRILEQVSDLEVEILLTAFQAPVCDPPFAGLRVVATKPLDGAISGKDSLPILQDRFADHPAYIVRHAVSRLVSLGLLRDEGLQRVGIPPLDLLVVADLGAWFLGWLSEEAHATSHRTNHI